MKKVNSRGFTLIELLVVISIIGVLAGLTLTGFTAARKNARDTQRKSDLNQYRIALENFAAVNNSFYPSGGTTNPIHAVNLCTAATFTGFMSTCPDDPRVSASQWYGYRANSSSPLGTANALKYLLYVNGGLEASSGKTWVVCWDGKVGLTDNTWAAMLAFCPL